MAEKNERTIKVVAENRKARFNYAIEDTVEAGIALTGTEVKSVRNGKTTIAESYADSKNGEIWLINANIPEYLQANRFNHEPKRPRKLLLHRKQINKLMGAVDREGMTLIVDDGIISHVFYPVFPPNRNAGDVLAWLRANPVPQ
jgi:SsrA-binding protein